MAHLFRVRDECLKQPRTGFALVQPGVHGGSQHLRSVDKLVCRCALFGLLQQQQRHGGAFEPDKGLQGIAIHAGVHLGRGEEAVALAQGYLDPRGRDRNGSVGKFLHHLLLLCA